LLYETLIYSQINQSCDELFERADHHFQINLLIGVNEDDFSLSFIYNVKK